MKIIIGLLILIPWSLFLMAAVYHVRHIKWVTKISKWFEKTFLKPVKSTILCIRYPFLYPRNRFTGKHYNNWKLIEKHRDIYKKYHVFVAEEGAYEKYRNISNIQSDVVGENFKTIWFLKKIGDKGWCEFWRNPFAMFYVKIIDFIHDYVLQIFHCIPTYTELDFFKSEAPGWYKAFGMQLCKDLKKQLIKDKCLYSFRIMQWKEKNARMELYCNGASKKIYDIINKYSEISENTCIYCGVPAVYITSVYSYALPYCEKCYEKTNKPSIAYVKDKNGEWKQHPDYQEL